jgi:hypothetical protein
MVDETPIEGDLDFTRGVRGSRLKVIVNRNGAQISGRVLDKDGEPITLPQTLVVLTQATNLAWPMPSGSVAQVINGEYVFHGIHPGKYRFFAIDLLEHTNISAPDALNPVAAAAPEIEIKAGERLVRDIKVSSKVSSDAPKQ